MKPKAKSSSSDGGGNDRSRSEDTRAISRSEPLLDSSEAAELLGIHPKTLQGMARRRGIPGLQTEKLWWFRMSELNAWLREKLPARRKPVFTLNAADE